MRVPLKSLQKEPPKNGTGAKPVKEGGWGIFKKAKILYCGAGGALGRFPEVGIGESGKFTRGGFLSEKSRGRHT